MMLNAWIPRARQLSGTVAAFAVAAPISGCAVGPGFRRPAPPALLDYARPSRGAQTTSVEIAGGEAQWFLYDQQLSQQWWTVCESPALNARIDKALSASPTLVAAEAAPRQACALVLAQQGAFFPTVAASFSPSRQKASATLSPPLSTNELTYNLYITPGTLSFTPDVFGGNRRQVESLRGLADAQRVQLEAVYVTLTSNPASAAIQEASVRAQTAASHEIIDVSMRSLALVRRQFGAVARLDVAAQKAALAQVQQALPPLQKQLEQTRNLLTALSGRFPSGEPEETFEVAVLRLPQDVPVGLPSTLIERRPDVRAAEAQLHAASAQIGIALASRFPQFTMTGAAGGTGLNFSISAAIGFVSLLEISVMNGILMLTYYHEVMQRGGMSSIDGMFHTASPHMRPVLMTSLSARIGLVPAAISTGIGSLLIRSSHVARARAGAVRRHLAAGGGTDGTPPIRMMPLNGFIGRARWLSGAMIAFAAVALMSGCAVGPNFRRPTALGVLNYARPSLAEKTASSGVAGGEEQRFVHEQQLSYQWWTLFGSARLNALIEKALNASPTLIAAQAALRQARELVYAQIGAFYPSVATSFSPSRQKASATLSPPLSTNELTYNLFTTQGTLSFTPDVFGGNRRQVESLIGSAEAQRFQLDAAHLTLTSSLASAAIQEALLRAQTAATQEVIDISARSLALFRRQFELGAVARLDVAAQEAALAQVQQMLPPLQKQLEQTRNLLAVLSGRFPSDEAEETFELTALQLPQDLPVGLPSTLVERRLDVRVAEAQFHAASAQIGVALASRLPQFTVTAAYGGTSTVFTQMFANGNPFWSVVGNVAQTLFDGGTLLHRQRAAEAAFEQAAAQYRSVVLSAFQNVADALHALQADAETLKAAVAAEQATKVSLDLTLTAQQLGAVNYLAVLSAQQAYRQALLTRVQAQAARLSDTVALFQALGGGWWNRPDREAALATERPSGRKE
jgi:NodT family efflux transporter outer membrane factor (OMF) lipoprotein